MPLTERTNKKHMARENGGNAEYEIGTVGGLCKNQSFRVSPRKLVKYLELFILRGLNKCIRQ